MTLNDLERSYAVQLFPELAIYKLMNIDPYCRQQKDSPGSVDFSNVQIVRKFASWVTYNLDCKVMINVKYLENGTRCTTDN